MNSKYIESQIETPKSTNEVWRMLVTTTTKSMILTKLLTQHTELHINQFLLPAAILRLMLTDYWVIAEERPNNFFLVGKRLQLGIIAMNSFKAIYVK